MLADARRRRGEHAGGAPLPVETWAAFAGAALFAVHPIQSETAGYVSSRSEILCALFLVGALLLARVAKGGLAPAGGTPPGPAASGGGHGRGLRLRRAGAALEGSGSRPAGAVRRLRLAAAAGRHPRQAAPAGGGSSYRSPCVTLAALVYRVGALAGQDARLSQAPLLNLLGQSIVIWRYLAMMVIPVNQAIMHEIRAITTVADPVALLAAAGLVALLAVAFRARAASPLYALGAVWWFACIAPSSSVIALREGMAEHRVYVASVGVATVVTAIAAQLIARSVGAAGRVPARWTAGLVGLLAVCAALTVRRNHRVGQSGEGLAGSRGESRPGMWEPRYALADALREAGDCAAALAEYEAVLAAAAAPP